MQEVPDYFIYKCILQGYELKLADNQLQQFVLESTGCTLEKYEEILDQIMDAWIK